MINDPYALSEAESARLEAMPRKSGEIGSLYLLHFSEPLHHAQHYLGFARNLDNRLEEHVRGKGSSLTKAAFLHGISFELVKTWEGDRTLEREFKNRKNLRRLCPLCVAGVNERSRIRMRKKRHTHTHTHTRNRSCTPLEYLRRAQACAMA